VIATKDEIKRGGAGKTVGYVVLGGLAALGVLLLVAAAAYASS
jgi:hypothetical protein